MVTPLRIVYFGTPAFAGPPLVALLDAGHVIAGVVTQPDRPRGRGQRVSAPPVKVIASARGIPVVQPQRLADPALLESIGAWRPDLAVVAAYGRLLPQALLDLPRLGFINVHASLLPRWRGAAPVHRALLAGDTMTGVSIMRVVLALDAGPVLAGDRVPIGPNETSEELEARLASVGAGLLVRTVADLVSGRAHATPQDESAVTYAARLTRADSSIEWSQPAPATHNQIRGLHPWPLATTWLGTRRVIIHRSLVESVDNVSPAPGEILVAHDDALVVAAGVGSVRVLALQLDGRRLTDARSFINGAHVHAGDRFTAVPAGH